MSPRTKGGFRRGQKCRQCWHSYEAHLSGQCNAIGCRCSRFWPSAAYLDRDHHDAHRDAEAEADPE